MNQPDAYRLFKLLAAVAKTKIIQITRSQELEVLQKSDKTPVTECDRSIDKSLRKIAEEHGIPVISEEGENNLDIVKKGTYLTIDPIDATACYIRHVEGAIREGDMEKYPIPTMGPGEDHTLLLGFVEDGQPKFGACHNYVTGDFVFIDPKQVVFEGPNARFSRAGYVVCYTPKELNELEQEAINRGAEQLVQSSAGFRLTVALLTPHQASLATKIKDDRMGLWDVVPACAAARWRKDANVLDGHGNTIKFTEYIKIPGGLVAYRGEEFDWVKDALKK